jgi:tetratricopeptide (TPR) repeat protein
MMSAENNESEADAAADEVCASCGIAAVDITLKKCACGLVKYCSVDCQKNHRPQHKKLCRKRLAEIRDRDLLKQPDGSHLGECPICFLPLPIDMSKSILMSCCCKLVCKGCSYANQMREIEEGLEQRCAFCREPMAKSEEEHDKRCMKRIKENDDPAALCQMGKHHFNEGDYETAVKYFTKAAELGNASAHYSLSIFYRDGEGVEKDVKKQVYHLEEAAIGGHPDARHYLGGAEVNNGRYERARKHWIIAANLGFHDSLKGLKGLHEIGQASKEEYADALRAYQAAVDATKSSQREEAEHFRQWLAQRGERNC